MKPLNIKNENEIFQSIYDGNVEKVQKILISNPMRANDLSSEGSGVTPLILAINLKRYQIIKLLLKYDVIINTVFVSKYSHTLSTLGLVGVKGDLESLMIIFNAKFNQDPDMFFDAISGGLQEKNNSFVEKTLIVLEPHINNLYPKLIKNLVIQDDLKSASWIYDFATKRVDINTVEFRAEMHNLIELAIKHGNAELVERIISGLGLSLHEYENHCNENVLQICAKNDKLDLLMALEKKCSRVITGAISSMGETLLHIAAQNFSRMEDVENLLDTYKDSFAPMSLTFEDNNLLHLAAKAGNLNLLIPLRKKFPQLNFNELNAFGDSVYNLLGLGMLVDNKGTELEFDQSFKKMIEIDGIMCDNFRELDETWRDRYGIQNYFYHTFKKLRVAFEKLFTLNDLSYSHFNKGFSSAKKVVKNENSLLGLKVLNNDGKTLIQLLIEQGDVDSLTMFFLDLGIYNKNNEGFQLNNLIGQNVTYEDEEEVVNRSSQLCTILDSIDFNHISKKQLNVLNWALARCGVKSCLEFFLDKSNNIELLRNTIELKKSPYYEKDLTILLEGLVKDKIQASKGKVDFANFEVTTISQGDSVEEMTECLKSKRELIIALAQRLKRFDIVSQYVEVLSGGTGQKGTYKVNNPNAESKGVLVLLALLRKINKQKSKIEKLKVDLKNKRAT